MEKCGSLVTLLLLLILSQNIFAQKWQSDNENGTFTNPVIAADFPDPDVIRVGDTYYMVTTTMFIFPGGYRSEIARPRKLGSYRGLC